MEKKFVEVFETMNDLRDVQELFINNAKRMAEIHPSFNVYYKTDVRITTDKDGKEVPEMTCTMKISKKNEIVKFL